MKQALRTFSVALLVAALLHASAGLCFCHRGPVAPGTASSSGGCCHAPAASGVAAWYAASSCCHVEAVERQVLPSAALRLAPPPTVEFAAPEASVARAVPVAARVLPAPSPPLVALRI
jgi:hypothetical protein